MNEISKRKRKKEKKERKSNMSKACSFASSEPKTGNFISPTRKENINNYMLLPVHKIKTTNSLKEVQLLLI